MGIGRNNLETITRASEFPPGITSRDMKRETIALQVPEYVVEDIDLVVSLLRVTRDSLLAGIIEREVSREKERLLMELGALYAQDKISKNDLVKMVGESLADDMELIKTKTEQSWVGAMEYARRLDTSNDK